MSVPPTAHARFLTLDVAADTEWQMHLGERFALEGLLRSLRPAVSIEVGRAEGGSLRRIAAHSEQVHSFDLVPEPEPLRESLRNVVFHTGDSSVQLPETLQQLGEEGIDVDFALVDGDHTPDGVRRDAEALLRADCCRNTVIVFHDAANEDVRAGLEAVDFIHHPKVALAMLDFVPGFVVEKGPHSMQIWNGLGLVVLAEGQAATVPVVERLRFDAAEMNRIARDAVREAAPPAATAPARTPAPKRAAIRVAGLSAVTAAGAALFATRSRRRS